MGNLGQRSHCSLGSFKGAVLKPKKCSYKEDTWVSRAVLSTDYDDVSLFLERNPGLYQKEGQSWLKNG